MTETSEYSWVTVKLVAIISLIFILQLFFPSITELLRLDSSLVSSEPWRLLTAILIHANLAHLLLNMFALGMFGSILEKFIGWKQFLIVFFSTGFLANIVAVFFYPSSLGASGAIFGVIGALAVIRPSMTVWVLGVPMPMILAAVVWAIQDTVGIFVPDNTGHIAHLGGLVLGVMYGIPKFKWNRKEKRIEVLTKQQMESWEQEHMRR